MPVSPASLRVVLAKSALGRSRSVADKAKLTKLAERAAKSATAGDDAAVVKIDEIIYRLFDLTAAEITSR